MQGSIRLKAMLSAAVLVAMAGVAGGVADAQQVAERFRFPSGVGSTVSVATLRIPEKAWKHFEKAKDAAQHNRLAESDRETQKALVIAPDFAAAYLLRADSELRQHAYEAAIADVKQARRVEPDLMWSGIVLAGAYNGLRRYGDARLVLNGLHGPEAEAWQAAYERARTATGLNDLEGALHWSAVALDAAPEEFPDVLLVRTNAFLEAKRWSEAQAQMELYLQAKGPLDRRAEVMAMLDRVKRLAREDELQKLASR
jgi:tetratricopeptide (TPR) repeat protein